MNAAKLGYGYRLELRTVFGLYQHLHAALKWIYRYSDRLLSSSCCCNIRISALTALSDDTVCRVNWDCVFGVASGICRSVANLAATEDGSFKVELSVLVWKKAQDSLQYLSKSGSHLSSSPHTHMYGPLGLDPQQCEGKGW